MQTINIQCLQHRAKGTKVTLGKSTYLFKANKLGHHVCAVSDSKHIASFLKVSEGYRIYEGEDRETASVPVSEGEDDGEGEDEGLEPANEQLSAPAGEPVADRSVVYTQEDLDGMTDEQVAVTFVKVVGKSPAANASRATMTNRILSVLAGE